MKAENSLEKRWEGGTYRFKGSHIRHSIVGRNVVHSLAACLALKEEIGLLWDALEGPITCTEIESCCPVIGVVLLI